MIADGVFIAIAVMTLIGAALAVGLGNVFYNAVSLIVCLFGVAALFIYLNSEFLAVMEVIIYIGAISVAIIFAIMLSQTMLPKAQPSNRYKIARSAVIAMLVFYGTWAALRRSVPSLATVEGDYGIRAIGRSLLTQNVLPFEVISIVLLIAIIGALYLAGTKGASR